MATISDTTLETFNPRVVGSSPTGLTGVMSQDIPDGGTHIPWVRPSVI